MSRSTLDMPSDDHEKRWRPPVDEVEVEQLPQVSAELPETPDGLPGKSACRWCGRRTDTERRFGGVMRVGEFDPLPGDAFDVHRVRVCTPPAVAAHAVETGRAVSLTHASMSLGAVVQEFEVPVWRVCPACEPLMVSESPIKLLAALLQVPLPNDPVHIRVADAHAPVPYWAMPGVDPSDRGSGRPWAHVDRDAVEVVRVELASLQKAGGVPSPTGEPCGICGRTGSPYGWMESLWKPPEGRYGPRSGRVPVCGGTRRVHRPDAPYFARWESVPTGCEVLLTGSRNGLLTPLHELAWRAAEKAGVVLPSWTVWHVADTRRLLAFAHPDYGRLGEVREPWWHVPDAPLVPLTPEAELSERLAQVEAELAAKGAA